MKWISDKSLTHLREITELPDLEGTPYRLEREIGRGGMGVVHLAYDTKLNRQVAIKVLTTTLLTPSMANLMIREARVIARLEHPGIVPVHDCGVLTDGRVFYVMKFVRGRRLDEYFETVDSLFDRLRLFLKACEAVAFAHAGGVVHCDLKPENIMVGPFGEVLVMDRGTAKILRGVASNVETNNGEVSLGPQPIASATSDKTTRDVSLSFEASNTTDAGVIGTPAYMSPEQANGSRGIDQRTDVYSLGAVLYFILTKRPPSNVTKVEEGVQRHLPPLIRPRVINKSIRKPLEAICLRALSTEAADRYDTVDAMAQDISRFLEGQSTQAYRENPFERIDRWLATNRFIVLLVLAYLLMRILLIFV